MTQGTAADAAATVEAQVSAILAKLGLRSHTQIATYTRADPGGRPPSAP